MRAAFLALILLVIYASGVSAKDKRLNGSFSLIGEKVTGEVNEAQIFGVKTSLTYQQRLLKRLSMKVGASLSLETGNSETLLGLGSYKPSNSISLSEAELRFKANQKVELRAGALNQRYHKNPLMMTSTPFIGAREILSHQYRQWTFQLDLLQSIPSNQNLSRRLGGVSEGSAAFFNEKIRAKAKGDLFDFQASVGHFAFDQLNSDVAYQSRLLGNTVSGVGSVNNRFVYSFVGWNGDLSLKYKGLSNIHLTFDSAWQFNTKAPDGRNLAYMLSPGLKWGKNKRLYKFSLAYFENQSDSSVAYYSSKVFGHMNRTGGLFNVEVEDRTYQLNYGFRGVRTNPIVETPFQNEETIFSVFMGKDYEIF